ncbi:uncharacterized protein LOC109713945 [Ananas comosus]|uniref:Uncharacterized protein LOC109713945 n=1 Tax=Ananas comosus TaxID=4615 RepID=A0A6P5FE09_ANACO|nr:uncharacterized protein LOC109713945 [Ananas comosus]
MVCVHAGLWALKTLSLTNESEKEKDLFGLGQPNRNPSLSACPRIKALMRLLRRFEEEKLASYLYACNCCFCNLCTPGFPLREANSKSPLYVNNVGGCIKVIPPTSFGLCRSKARR